MKIIQNLIITTTLFIMSILSLPAQSTEGREFWLTFGRNGPFVISQGELEIRIVGGNLPTTGTIFFTNLGTSVDFNLAPHQIYTYSLDNNEKQAVYNTTMGVSNRSIRIITYDEPVTVYAMSSFQTTDATNILPVTALGMEYFNISHIPYLFEGTGVNTYDAYAVVATEDNTKVYQDGILLGTLNRGGVYYQIKNSDMTGFRITSDNPVAFFALCQVTYIPLTAKVASNLYQQLAPVNTWGKEFFVPVSHQNFDRVRIVASQNNTVITQIGGTLMTGTGGQSSYTIHAGQFIELEVALSTNGCYIYSNNPIEVCSYLSKWHNTLIDEAPASQCWIPAVEQTTTKALIASFTRKGIIGYANHNALVVTSTGTKDATRVSIGGGAAESLSGGYWIDNSAAGMSFYTFPLINDTVSYYFTNPKGLIILCYGYKYDWSYYYLAGSAMRDLDAAFYANDIHFQDLKDNSMCEGDVHFRAEIEGLHQTASERIKWFVNGTEEPGTLNQETWQKNFTAGNYDIRMWVRYENDDTISKTGTLIIKSCNQSAVFFANNVLHSELKDTTFCNKSVNFRAEIEGLHPTASDSIMWYINDVFETSQATWNKTFENGTYEIKLVVHYDNDTYATLTGTLKIQALWIKIRNVRY